MKAINCLLWECLAIVPSALMAQTTNSQPNIVLILADDMGRECLVPITPQTLTDFRK